MQIVLAVTNDISTDQRLIRTAITLSCMPARVTIIGRRQGDLILSLPGIQTTRMRLLFNRGPLFYAEYNIRLFFRLLFAKADVYTANDLDTLPAVYLAARLKNKAVVYDSHEYFTEVPELMGRNLVQGLWQRLEALMLPRIRFSSTVSSSIAGAYHQKYGITMEVIRNLPVRKDMPLQDTPADRNLPHTILYQGSLNKGRGLELAISAMKFMTGTTLKIIGSGDIENDLKELAKNLGLSEVVHFTGRIITEDLPYHTAGADLGISLEEDMGLSYRYALPNKVFDYIQAQIPVLVSDLPEMSQLVEKYGVGMVCKTREPEALAGIFTDMLTNREKRSHWKMNLVTASGELCWEKEAYKVVALYQKAFH
jgi:glycosyltransferase involved in cell wall biosynthesis